MILTVNSSWKFLSWQIWKQRNDFIFNKDSPSFLSWKLGFLGQANLQANRLREDKNNSFSILSACTYSFALFFSFSVVGLRPCLYLCICSYLFKLIKVSTQQGFPLLFLVKKKIRCMYISTCFINLRLILVVHLYRLHLKHSNFSCD
jgi:hypothetical protein